MQNLIFARDGYWALATAASSLAAKGYRIWSGRFGDLARRPHDAHLESVLISGSFGPDHPAFPQEAGDNCPEFPVLA